MPPAFNNDRALRTCLPTLLVEPRGRPLFPPRPGISPPFLLTDREFFAGTTHGTQACRMASAAPGAGFVLDGELKGHAGEVLAVAVSPNGGSDHVATAAEDGGAKQSSPTPHTTHHPHHTSPTTTPS